MGFQTNISILNDHFDWIEENPREFVAGITIAMNYGNESLTDKVRVKRTIHPEESAITSHYVTVHKAQHADVQQVTYTHQNSSYDVWDVTRGIQLGYLDTVSNPEIYVQIYKQIARELRRQAADLSKAIKEYDKMDDAAMLEHLEMEGSS